MGEALYTGSCATFMGQFLRELGLVSLCKGLKRGTRMGEPLAVIRHVAVAASMIEQLSAGRTWMSIVMSGAGALNLDGGSAGSHQANEGSNDHA